MWPLNNKDPKYSSPSTILRVLRNPIFDTEYAGPEKSWIPLFIRPIGQANTVGRIKTFSDTNLTQAGCLGSPCEFDWYQWRTELDPSIPLQELLAFRYFSRLSFRFGERVWFNMPLSYVPFTAYRGAEEIKQIAPVLACEGTLDQFAEVWDKATVVRNGDKPPQAAELIKERINIYRTEEARRMDSSETPIRIRSHESFFVEVHTDWGASAKMPKVDFAMRLYFEGLLYVPI